MSRARGVAPRPEALTTDAWYTILYVSPAERAALDARRRRLWSEPLLAHGLSRAATVALLARRDRWNRAAEARGRTPTVLEQVRALARWSGARLDEDDLPQRLDRTLLRARVDPAPGAREALRGLERAGVPLAVVSNVLNETGHAARTILERLDLLARFRAVVLSCEHPWAKPAPEPFALAARFLGVPPGRAVHIGDLRYDVDGARSAGLRAWWYTGLRRLNGYLPAQVAEGSVPPRDIVRSWASVRAERFARP